jgi:hypothetical protein
MMNPPQEKRNMDEKARKAYKEAFTLKEAGAKWSTVIEKLKEGELVNSKGHPFAASTLRKEYSMAKKDPDKWRVIMGEDLTSEQAERSAHPECSECYERSDQSESSDQANRSDYSTRSEQHQRSDQSEYSEDRVRQITEEVCQAMIQHVLSDRNMRNVLNVQDDIEAPPEPIRRGRKQNRIYGKLGATADAVLLELFNAEARSQGISTGRLMDTILWERYGKPILSYEMAEGPELAALKKKYGKGRE